jgi:hypothetical protein
VVPPAEVLLLWNKGIGRWGAASFSRGWGKTEEVILSSGGTGRSADPQLSSLSAEDDSLLGVLPR